MPILDLIPLERIFSGGSWVWLVEPRFSIALFILFVITVLLLVVFVTPRLFRDNKRKRKQDKLRKYNHWEDVENRILVTWDVHFGTLRSSDPFVSNVNVFCAMHKEAPLRMISNHCPDAHCPSSIVSYSPCELKNEIESKILHLWSEYNQQWLISYL